MWRGGLVTDFQGTGSLFASEGNWRESEAIKQARTWLVEIGDPRVRPRPCHSESEWAELLRDVLAERDFLGEWVQRYLDADHVREISATPRRGGPHAPNCASIITGGDIVCSCPPEPSDA